MAAIIDLQTERQRRQPHEAGMAECMCCWFDWVAVAPAGTETLECPSCHKHAGRWMQTTQGPVCSYSCDCGGLLFRIRADGIYCTECGQRQEESL